MQDVLEPIASLISKSAKAQRKLAPGTWQHAMLRDNLRALRLAVALMGAGGGEAGRFSRDELRDAVRALRAMIGRTAKARAKFTRGTSHHTLLRNRLNALRAAKALTRAALDGLMRRGSNAA